MMRILQFIRLFNESTATFVYNELEELSRAGHDVKVACTRRINEAQYPFEDVEIVPLTVWQGKLSSALRRLGWRYYFGNSAFREHFRKMVSDYRPDVIHCQFGVDALFVLDNFKDLSIPVFITFHGYDASSLLKVGAYRRRLREVFSRKHVFPVFVSAYMRENVRSYGVEIPRSFILYCGIDIDFFSRAKMPPENAPFTFLQVSSFREKKGHACTLEAFAKMLDQHPGVDARLILAGDGPLRPSMIALAERLGIAGKVFFPGLVTPGEAKRLMEEANAFVHHSVQAASGDMEGIPTAIMEAMAMELPALSTIHSGIPELVEDGLNGFLVRERDIATYAQRLFELLDWDLKKENRQKIASLFERKQHARTLVNYYKQAIEKLSLKNE